MSWKASLDDFLEHAAVTHPTAATTQHAVAYRSWLLSRLSPTTVKTRLAFLAGLWTVLCELRPDATHVFQGLNKRIKVVKSRKQKSHSLIRRSGRAWVNRWRFFSSCISRALGLLRLLVCKLKTCVTIEYSSDLCLLYTSPSPRD